MQLQPVEASSSDGEPSESAKTEDTESQVEEGRTVRFLRLFFKCCCLKLVRNFGIFKSDP